MIWQVDMMPACKLILIALTLLATPFWLAIIHPVVARIFQAMGKDRGPQFNAIVAMLLLNVIWVGLSMPLADAIQADSYWAFLFYLLFTLNGMNMFYFQCVNISLTSIHMNILMTVARAGKISRADLLARYDDRHMIHTRLKRLQSLGQLAVEPDGHTVRLSSWLFIILSSPLYGWRWALGLKGEK